MNSEKTFACSKIVSKKKDVYMFSAKFKGLAPEESSVKNVTLFLYGAYNCPTKITEPFDATDEDVVLDDTLDLSFLSPREEKANVSMVITIQSQAFYVNALVDQGNCTNPYCFSQGIEIQLQDVEIYNSQKENLIRMFSSSPMCFTQVIVETSWTYFPPEILSISPSCGPIQGGTQLLVEMAQPLRKEEHLVCNFGDSASDAKKADFHSNFIVCSTPRMNSTGTSSLTVSRKEAPACKSKEFAFEFYDTHIDSIAPRKAKLFDKAVVTITTENLSPNCASVVCRFVPENGSPDVNVTGRVDAQSVFCTTPEWKEEGDVVLSISFNGGRDFATESFIFTFYKVHPVFSDEDWFTIGIAGTVFVVAAFFVVFCCVQKRCSSGYKKLSDKNEDISLNDVKIFERIGKGTFADVYRAQWCGTTIALKKIPIQSLKGAAKKDVQREVDMMKSFHHPNILQYLGCCFESPDLYIAVEYMSRGDLYSILHNAEIQLTWDTVIKILTDTTRGMIYLHSLSPPIIHRDLKSHNLLVSENWKVKVGDFGLSTYLDQQSTMTSCGTPSWTAPEVIRHARYTEKADVYSFGVVMWECVTRDDPYAGLPPFKVIYAVGNQGMRPAIPQYVPAPYRTLIKRCWHEEPERRPRFDEVIVELINFEKNGFSKSVDILSPREQNAPALTDIIPASPVRKKKKTPRVQVKKVQNSHDHQPSTPSSLRGSANGVSGYSATPPGVSFTAAAVAEQSTSVNPTSNILIGETVTPPQLYGTFIPPFAGSPPIQQNSATGNRDTRQRSTSIGAQPFIYSINNVNY